MHVLTSPACYLLLSTFRCLSIPILIYLVSAVVKLQLDEEVSTWVKLPLWSPFVCHNFITELIGIAILSIQFAACCLSFINRSTYSPTSSTVELTSSSGYEEVHLYLVTCPLVLKKRSTERKIKRTIVRRYKHLYIYTYIHTYMLETLGSIFGI